MSPWRLAIQSLRHYRWLNLAVLGGIALAETTDYAIYPHWHSAHFADEGAEITSAVYTEAYRLLKHLSLFVPIFPDEVPYTSIIREFIGGSSFSY